MFENFLIGTLGGAVGGLVTLGGKFVLDRTIERYKAAVASDAKRRDRYYEKQNVVPSGAYERLARCVMPTSKLYIEFETMPDI